MPTRRTLVSGFAALALAGSLLGASAPAFAASSSGTASTAASGPKTDGAHSICMRAPRIDARISRDLTRLNGPVTRVGSVARLEKRVADAKAAGQTAIETYLQDRLTAREALIPTLKQRQSDLAAVEAWCGTTDNGTSNGSSNGTGNS
jgi:hypothetical protein